MAARLVRCLRTGVRTDLQKLDEIKVIFDLKQSHIKTYKQICFTVANITLGNCPTDRENKLLQKLLQQSAKISKPSSAILCHMTLFS